MERGRSWKLYLRRLLPEPVLEWLAEIRFRRLNSQVDAAFAGEDVPDVFSNIYKSGIWGQTAGTDFFSGDGSHDSKLVDPYIQSVVAFLSSLPSKPSVVDLGCGDFNVGSRIRPFCNQYVACDVVPGLIDHNRAKFCDLDTEFRCLNAVEDDLPDGDVVFLRQVLQHLSNEHIAGVVRKLGKYRFLVFTETLPAKPGFVPNLEKQTGPGIRIANRSGVVLTEPPFFLSFVSKKEICSIAGKGTKTQTIVYQLQ